MKRIKQGDGKLGESLRKLAVYCKRELPIIIMGVVLSMAAALIRIIGPQQIRTITNTIYDGLTGSIDMGLIGNTALLLIGLYLGSEACGFIEKYLLTGVAQTVSKRLRGDLDEKINRLPLSYFGRNQIGDVLSHVTNDVDMISQGLSNSFMQIVTSLVSFVGCIVLMCLTNGTLALTTIGTSLLGIILMVLIAKKSQPYFDARQKDLGALNGYIEEMYAGHDVIRISGAEAQVKTEFDKLNRKVWNANFKSQFLSGLMMPVMSMIGNLGYVAVCIVGAILVLNGSAKFGDITAFLIYVRLFESPLKRVAQSMSGIQAAGAAAGRVLTFLEEEELEDESHKPKNFALSNGDVSFHDISFAYPEAPEREIIHHFSAEFRPGQKIAIVGPTGAGKTTLVNLLMRFYEPTGGEIRIDGENIRDLSRSAVHDAFGMVLQDTWLFEGTVRENLIFNGEGIRNEKMIEAAKACGIHSFIQALPNGYDTVLNDNTSISVGQRQLFTIARAMIQNHPMLILDEATSSVDTRTELLIQQAMDALTEHRTSFVIAHRLSTIQNADVILVVRDGDIVERGTHEELLKKNGFYAELYNSQFAVA